MLTCQEMGHDVHTGNEARVARQGIISPFSARLCVRVAFLMFAIELPKLIVAIKTTMA